MAAQWDRLVARPEFQALPQEKREQARQRYFEAVLAPRIPAAKKEQALARWNKYRPEDQYSTPIDDILTARGEKAPQERSRVPVPMRADLLDNIEQGEVYTDAKGKQAVVRDGLPLPEGFDRASAAPSTIAAPERVQEEPEQTQHDIQQMTDEGLVAETAPQPEPTFAEKAGQGIRTALQMNPITAGLASRDGGMTADVVTQIAAYAPMAPGAALIGFMQMGGVAAKGYAEILDATGITQNAADSVKPIFETKYGQYYLRGIDAIDSAIAESFSKQTREQQQAMAQAIEQASQEGVGLPGIIKQIAAGAQAMIDNPRALAVTLARTVPDLLVAGGVSRAAVATDFADIYKMHIRAGMNPTLAASAAAKRTAAKATGAATAAETSVGSQMGAVEAAASINTLSDEELAEASPRFTQRAQEVGPEIARQEMIATATTAASAVSGLATGLGTAATGAGAMIGRAATRGVAPAAQSTGRGIAGTAGAGIKGGLREGAQEFVQEGGQGVAQNIAAQQSGRDDERGTFEGVAAQAGAGAVAGGIMGAPIGVMADGGRDAAAEQDERIRRAGMTPPQRGEGKPGQTRTGPGKAGQGRTKSGSLLDPVDVDGDMLVPVPDENGVVSWFAEGADQAFTSPDEYRQWKAEQGPEITGSTLPVPGQPGSIIQPGESADGVPSQGVRGADEPGVEAGGDQPGGTLPTAERAAQPDNSSGGQRTGDAAAPVGRDGALVPAGERADEPSPALTAPAKKPVLQNRDRSTAASIEQMQGIAKNPDYGRMGPSRDFSSGAPAVEPGANIPPERAGKQTFAVTAEGRRIPVQYAVVEADELLPSNRADGSTIDEYATGADGRSRVIAGNGRVAGLQRGIQMGNAGNYQQELLADLGEVGIDPAAVQGMKNPVLVRVMPSEEVTQNIGDESNVSGVSTMSASEQARNDVQRVNLPALDFGESGEVTPEAVRAFINSMPQSERAALMDGDTPSKQAIDRLNNAIFAAAYENDELVRLSAQAADPEARTVMTGLLNAAPIMARLTGAGDLDVRELVAEAAAAAVNARRDGQSLTDYLQQQDMTRDQLTAKILTVIADNIRSGKKIGEFLSAIADTFHAEAARPESDMFGKAPPKRSREELLEQVNADFQGRPGPSVNAGRARPDRTSDERSTAGAGAQGRAEPATPEPANQPEAGAQAARAGDGEQAGGQVGSDRPQGKVVPLRKIKVERPALNTETGETQTVIERADLALKDVDGQISAMRELLQCLRT